MSDKPRRRRHRLTEEERAKKREDDRELMAAAVRRLRKKEGWHLWLRVRSRFHTYSLANQLLIAFQMPDATKVAGFRKWLDLGYAVRKGERAIYIWAPCPPSKPRLEKWRREGADPKTKPRTFFRMVPVFDRSQVDPIPDFPNVAPLDPPEIHRVEGDGLASFLSPLKGFAASIGYSFTVKPTPAAVNGCCTPATNEIVVRPVGADYSPNAQIETSIHEISHALLRAERREDDPELSRHNEEVVVACVSFSVCSTFGLDTSGWNIAYIASWGDGEEIERYAGLIDRLARRIEDAVLPGAALVSPPAALAA